MERENIDFYTKVREGYLLLAKELPDRLVVISGADKESNVQKAIWAAVKPRLNGSLGSPPRKKVSVQKTVRPVPLKKS